MPEFTQLDKAKSMIRNLPPKGIAGFARQLVSSWRRLPRPPARIRASVLFVGAPTACRACTPGGNVDTVPCSWREPIGNASLGFRPSRGVARTGGQHVTALALVF